MKIRAIALLPVVLDQARAHPQSGFRFARGPEQRPNPPRVIGIAGRLLNHSRVHMLHTHRRLSFDPRPVGHRFKLVLLPERIEEAGLRQQVRQRLPFGGFLTLPGQFIELAGALRLAMKVSGKRAVRALPMAGRWQIRLLDGLTQEIVREGQKAAPIHQGIAGGQKERTPHGPRQRRACGT